MASFNPSKEVPSEFYNAKTFFTLSGAAAGVWIFCLVLGSICPTNSISPLLYRIIAISLSEIIALFMVYRAKRKKLENWFLAIFNGLLIFVNASGWNVITTNNFFSDKNKDNSSALIPMKGNYAIAGFLFFKNQIYWWQDNKVFLENRQLKEENKALTTKVDSLDRKISLINNGILNESNPYINQLTDSLKNDIKKKEDLINELKSENTLLKKTNNKSAITKTVITDTLPSEERIKLLNSIRVLRGDYETKLKICDREKRELQSKLNIINRGLDKYGGTP
jgi:hypothetical protein